MEILIRFNEGISILHKVQKLNEKSFNEIISSRKPFDLDTKVKGVKEKKVGFLKLYQNGGTAYWDKANIKKNLNLIDKHKVYISAAYGAGEGFPHQILGTPLYGEPNSICTETYLVIGGYNDEETAKNVISYIKTKFFRFLVLLIKNTQHATQKVYQLVPMQDFSRPWTDEELYKKYKLTKQEIAFIEKMVRPMDAEQD